VKIGSYRFNLQELAGALGDFGTLLPLAIGYIVVCGMNPAGLLVMMGLANLVTGLVYGLPLPIEPMKVLAVMAIAQAWDPSKIYAAGLAMGDAMRHVSRWTPRSVVRGIQLSLGLLLALKGVGMARSGWLLALLALAIIVLLRRNRYAPAALVLVALGLGIMAWQGRLSGLGSPSFGLPPLTGVDPRLLWPALRDGGLAQIPLTATNAVIATAALLTQYWPQSRVTERQLALNMGVMNLVSPFFGGMPLCHGAGGLAGQYYFGARTGGANVMEGIIEIGLGLILAGSIARLFAAFPPAIVGAMMIMVGLGLARFVRELRPGPDLLPLGATVLGSLAANMAVGFVLGLAVHYLVSARLRGGRAGEDPVSREG